MCPGGKLISVYFQTVAVKSELKPEGEAFKLPVTLVSMLTVGLEY